MTTLITRLDDERLGSADSEAMNVLRDSLRANIQHIAELEEKNAHIERLWSEDRAAVKDWAAASDAIGELYEILSITKDSAGFEDGFTKIVAAAKVLQAEIANALSRIEKAEEEVKKYSRMLDEVGK